MTPLLLLSAGTAAAWGASELVLRGAKLHTAVHRAAAVHAVVWAALLWPLHRHGALGVVPFTIFWGGLFLSWFGVRSHLESSILLRLLALLRGTPAPVAAAELVALYETRHGAAPRIDELVRGGLVLRDGARLRLTPRGTSLLRTVTLLR